MADICFIFCLFPLSMILYFSLPKKYNKSVLIIFGILFVLLNGLSLFAISAIMTVCTYFIGKSCSKNKKLSKILIIILEIIYVGLLIFLHYAYNNSFFDDKSIFLKYPFGISYLSISSYLYYKDRKLNLINKNNGFLDCLFYMFYFPKFLLGPVISPRSFFYSFENRKYDLNTLRHGFRYFIIGICVRILIADTIGKLNTTVFTFNLQSTSVALLWFNSLAYYIYIYLIFSSFSMMSYGTSYVFGIKIPINSIAFFMPDNFSDVLKKQNTSVTHFFEKEIALKTKAESTANSLISFFTWTAYGVWLGFSPQAIVFGLLCGVSSLLFSFPKNTNKNIDYPIRRIIILILDVIFCSLLIPKNTTYIVNYLRSMLFLNNISLWNGLASYYILEYFLIIFISIVIAACGANIRHIIFRKNTENHYIQEILNFIIVIAMFVISIAVLVYRGGISEVLFPL